MKTLMLAAAAAALAAAVTLTPVSAAEPKASDGNTWRGYPPTADGGAPGMATQTPHYEWQYHYVGRHPRLEGHWVLVR